MQMQRVIKRYDENLEVKKEIGRNVLSVYQDGREILQIPDEKCVESFINSDELVNKVLNTNLTLKTVDIWYTDDDDIKILLKTKLNGEYNAFFYYGDCLFNSGLFEDETLQEVVKNLKTVVKYYRSHIDSYLRRKAG